MHLRGRSINIGVRAKALLATLVVLTTIAFPAFFSYAAIGAPEITSPGANSLQPGSVSIRGNAPSGSTVEVRDAIAGVIATTAASNTGAWNATVAMGDGSHTVAAIATLGNETSLPSNSVTFEVDARRPAASITNPPANDYTFGPNDPISLRGTATDERGVFAVRLRYYLLDKLELEELAQCTCDGSTSTTWEHNPALSPGYYKVTATSIDMVGNQSFAVSRTFAAGPNAATPDLAELPGAPEIDGLEVPVPVAPLPGAVVPGAESPISFRGEADPGTTVEAFETKAGLGPLGYVDSDNKGTWRLRVVLPSGSYAVAFRAVDENGNVSPWSSVLPFEVDATRPALDILTGDNTVFLPLQPVILQGSTVDNRGVKSIIVEYWLGDRMMDRNVAACTGCSGRQVSWSDQPTLTEPGYYYAVVRAVDVAGNKSLVDSIHFLTVI